MLAARAAVTRLFRLSLPPSTQDAIQSQVRLRIYSVRGAALSSSEEMDALTGHLQAQISENRETMAALEQSLYQQHLPVFEQECRTLFQTDVVRASFFSSCRRSLGFAHLSKNYTREVMMRRGSGPEHLVLKALLNVRISTSSPQRPGLGAYAPIQAEASVQVVLRHQDLSGAIAADPTEIDAISRAVPLRLQSLSLGQYEDT